MTQISQNPQPLNRRKRLILKKVYSTDQQKYLPVAKIDGQWLSKSGFNPGDEVVVSNPELCTVVMHLSSVKGIEQRRRLADVARQEKVKWAFNAREAGQQTRQRK
jgi:hypothetical protein